ncbi:MAG: GNAT family N-acetyltransferase [Hungatella sp.]|nr:GNAT family N-acetyltransferase [Hungatella sp.]
MNIIQTSKPTDQQKLDMSSLVAACQKKEPLSLSAPLEDDLGYDILLGYEGPHLAAMAFLFFSTDTLCECCVFVHPQNRRNRLFTGLLDPILDLVEARQKALGQPIDFCFLADEKTPSAMAALKAIGAEYWYSEHKMERPLTSADREFVMDSLSIQEADDHLYSAVLDGRVIGTCAILPSQNRIYLYAFQIREDYQGQGYGSQFLSGMLAILAHMGLVVSLQVSGQNYIARNLYKKAGFSTVESLAYYLY